MTPDSPAAEGEPDFYDGVDRLARIFDDEHMQFAEHAIEWAMELVANFDSPKSADTEPPADAACMLYTPKVDAAFYLGLVIGTRLARTLVFAGGIPPGARD
jgi:hypothetical protein